MTPDNPLYWVKLIPARYRLWLYVAVGFASLLLAGWQATKGNYLAFAGYVSGSLANSLAAIHITPDPPTDEKAS